LAPLISTSPYIELPQGLGGWSGFLILIGVLLALAWKWRAYNRPWKGAQWAAFILLVVLQVIASLMFGVRLPSGNALPPPGLPAEPGNPAIMIFSALPWLLASCMLGPWAAGVLAMISGLTFALWGTHTLFTPLSPLGVLAGALVRQRYRTATFRLFTHPLAAALLLALIYHSST
jgi:hypothetical protein